MSEFIKAVVANANDEEFNKRGGRAKMAEFYRSQIDIEKARPVPPSDELIVQFEKVATLIATTGSWNEVIEAVADTMVGLATESKAYREGAYEDIQKMISEHAYEQMAMYFRDDTTKLQLCSALKSARNFLYYN